MMPHKLMPSFKLSLALSALILLGACTPLTSSKTASSAPAKPGSPEELLSAEGEWKLVEEQHTATPIQQHMKTRKQVNPAQLAKSQAYTENAASAHIEDDVHFRVLKLERQMNTLQSDFDKILPPLAKLPDPELRKTVQDIQSRPLEAPEETTTPLAHAPTPPMVITPEAPKHAKAPEPALSKGATSAPVVTSIRTGQHPGKIRLVLDLSDKTAFSADLDPSENLLVIELPQAHWSAEQEKLFHDPLLKHYTAEATATGTRLVMELKKSAKIVMKSTFPPNETHGHRIVIDIAPL